MKPFLGVNDGNLPSASTALNQLLAGELALFMQAGNYHCNI
jgi:hypothetical protein